MFGHDINQESLRRAMEHFKSSKEKGNSDERAVELALHWYLTYEDDRHGIMS